MVTIGFKLRNHITNFFSEKEVKGYVSPRVDADDRYIQISTILENDMDIHYEYYQGHVELHLEGKYQTSDLINKLREQTSDNPILSWIEWQGQENSRCQINKPTNDWDEVVEAFQAMMEIFDPIIEKNIAFLSSLSEDIIHTEQNDERQSSEIQAEVVPVRTLVDEKRLQIPTYQRPYRWEEKNVRQLLEDILASKNAGKKNYRIGSVILFSNEEKNVLEIVDGQQRLTTIFILLKCWNDKNKDSDSEDEKKRFNCPLEFGSESFDKIIDNYKFICAWIDENVKSDLNAFVKYVLDNCEFVRIVVFDITEAFQMFDSQNGRGKELEAYNLLKAYHIRAMEHDSREEKIKCDKRWEEATQYDPTPKIKDDPNIDILKQLFDEQLYRSRIWSRQMKAEEFSKTKIEEFKGFTIDKNHPAQFPYQNPQLLQYLTSKFYDTILSGTAATKNRFEYGDNEHINPFVNINQQIVNGKDFFDYVETYVEIYKQMFINIGTYQLSEFKDFYYTHCLNYCWGEKKYDIIKEERKNTEDKDVFKPKGPASRTGDTYLREAYKSIVFVLFDKFGEKGLNKYYKQLYRIIYVNRLTKSQVKYSFVSELPSEYFKMITNAKDLADLSEFDKKTNALYEPAYKEEGKINNPNIINFIKTGYHE